MDNRYFKNGCPPLMQDSRFITNYMESRVFEQFIRNVNKIDSAQDYKKFLQTHGDTIMNRERAYIESQSTCSVHGKCVPLSGKCAHADLLKSPDCGCNCKL
jgi:hypothetical protein